MLCDSICVNQMSWYELIEYTIIHLLYIKSARADGGREIIVHKKSELELVQISCFYVDVSLASQGQSGEISQTVVTVKFGSKLYSRYCSPMLFLHIYLSVV